MKFFEVQPALESGKKIKRHEWKHYLHIDEVKAFPMLDMVVRHIIVYNDDGTTDVKYFKSFDDDLLADDWEIVEDIPEAELHREIKYFYVCKCTATQYVNLDNEFHVCGNCGMRTKIIPQRRIKDYGLIESNW